MISPLDTRIAFFGGAAQPAVVEAIVKLKTAGFDVVVASHDPREAPALRDAGVTFIDDRMEALLDVYKRQIRCPSAVISPPPARCATNAVRPRSSSRRRAARGASA